jgi:hypothetical protein
MKNIERLDYIRDVENKLLNLKKAMFELTEIWLNDYKYDIDLNQYLNENYPFADSFDDQQISVGKWIINANKELSELKKDLQNE